MSYRLSPRAAVDIDEIGRHISLDSAYDAVRFIDRMTKKFVSPGRNPMIGRARPELRPELRSFPFGRYLILYKEVPNGVEIVRVAHSARNLDDLV